MAEENPDVRPQEQGEVEPPPPVIESRSYVFTQYFGMVPVAGDLPDEHLEVVTRQYAIKGLLFTVVGIIAIIFPFVFGLALEQLLGWLLVLGGGVTLIQCFMLCGSPGTTSFLLLGALHFCVGLWLLLKPLEGLTALTLILSGWFLAHGCLKVVMAWQVRHMRSWPAVLVSGLLSIVLGFLIVFLTPTYGLKLVGIIFGADLTATGLSVLTISIIAYFSRVYRSDLEAGNPREPLLANGSRRHVVAAVP